jgi:glycosyltransferase involved in cell wall biosynthesis
MRFTVLTPTFNRAHTLGRVYESLCAQTFRDFEWVIADDGSADGTKDLVSSWKPFFSIRYFWKPNSGKHTAMNLGVAKANGEFVLFFDSDDRCAPNALERFDYHWRQIPDPSRFANLSCLCRTEDGSIVGKPYPANSVDALTFADQLRYRDGERWGINRTDVLRQFPFPEGEHYVTESLIWNRIARKYAARFVNEPLRIYEPNANGIYRNSIGLRVSSPKCNLMYYRELIFSPAPIVLRLRAAVNFCRFEAIDVQRRLTRSLRAR